MARRKFPLNLTELDLSADKISSVIDQWIIGDNAERNRKILKRYYIDGICVDGKQPTTLASEFNMSPRQIRKIVDRYKKIIFKKLGLM